MVAMPRYRLASRSVLNQAAAAYAWPPAVQRLGVCHDVMLCQIKVPTNRQPFGCFSMFSTVSHLVSHCIIAPAHGHGIDSSYHSRFVKLRAMGVKLPPSTKHFCYSTFLTSTHQQCQHHRSVVRLTRGCRHWSRLKEADIQLGPDSDSILAISFPPYGSDSDLCRLQRTPNYESPRRLSQTRRTVARSYSSQAHLVASDRNRHHLRNGRCKGGGTHLRSMSEAFIIPFGLFSPSYLSRDVILIAVKSLAICAREN
ncbi:hypothetical protein EDB89DRAFT_719396 [Lactarius sanguifluus]|nr:hypothetical protein EDB89DRAFT_719396 [Lactarius sanguifluus]